MFLALSSAIKNKKGFTLTEIMVVVVIIGILVAIAIPIYKNSLQTNARDKADAANLRIIDGAVSQYLMKHPDAKAVDININPGPGILSEHIQDWPASPGTYTVENGKAKSTY